MTSPSEHTAQTPTPAPTVPVRYEHQARIAEEHIKLRRPRSPFSWAAEKFGEKIAAIVQIILGLLIALVGLPLLILPGPGLLVIFAGLALAGKGAKKLFGIKDKPAAS